MFINGILTGLILGAAIMFYWRLLMRVKRKERFQMAMDATLMNRVTKAPEIEKMIGNYPKWVQFSEFEQVEWLNVQLKELWPYVNKAVQDTIVETVEPTLEQYKPAIVTSMIFTRTDLGSNSPEIRGVKVHSLEKNQVVLDLDITWQGNCKFKLTIKTVTMATVIPTVEDLSFTGTLRLILELTDKSPVIAAYLAAINRAPTPPDYTLTYKLDGAGLKAIPGLPKMVDDIIRSSVDDTLLWPKRIVGSLIEGYDISHLEFKFSGSVVVTVVKAEGLKNMDTMGKSDPRVVVYLRKSHKAATPVKQNSLNPVWKDQVFELPVDDVHTAHLYFEVEDQDTLGFENMGYAVLPMEDVLAVEEETTFRIQVFNSLVSVERTTEEYGWLVVTAVYRNFDDAEERDQVTKAEQDRLTQKRTEEVDEALSPEAAKAAKAKAVASAKNRAANVDTLKGVAFAADKLINLRKGNLEGQSDSEDEDEDEKKGTPAPPATAPATATASVASTASATATPSATGTPASASGSGAPVPPPADAGRKVAAAGAAGFAAAAARAHAQASSATGGAPNGHISPAPSAEATKPAPVASSVAAVVPGAGEGAAIRVPGASDGVGTQPGATLGTPAAVGSTGAKVEAVQRSVEGAVSGEGGPKKLVVKGLDDDEDTTEVGATISEQAAAAAYATQAVAEEEKIHGKHKVSAFFKNVGKRGHGEGGSAAVGVPTDSPGLDRPVTPASGNGATPKKHGLGLFKHKEKKAPE